MRGSLYLYLWKVVFRAYSISVFLLFLLMMVESESSRCVSGWCAPQAQEDRREEGARLLQRQQEEAATQEEKVERLQELIHTTRLTTAATTAKVATYSTYRVSIPLFPPHCNDIWSNANSQYIPSWVRGILSPKGITYSFREGAEQGIFRAKVCSIQRQIFFLLGQNLFITI